MYTYWSMASVIVLMIGFILQFPAWTMIAVAIAGVLTSFKTTGYIKWFVLGANGLFLLIAAYFACCSCLHLYRNDYVCLMS
ncbi:hypothetical protein JCM19046_4334 [Bacillus sp. JCM 19046]|nr:hypothetical protein JCM19046_4334 [Bacillus sp. JCM 19046]